MTRKQVLTNENIRTDIKNALKHPATLSHAEHHKSIFPLLVFSTIMLIAIVLFQNYYKVVSGSCTVDGSDITYNVVLVPWYVGWLNHNYNNGNNSMTGDWPLIYTNGFKTSAMALGFSGDSFSGNVSGYFVGTWRNVKGTAGDILDLCDNDQWLSGAHLGLSTGIGDNPSSRSFRGYLLFLSISDKA